MSAKISQMPAGGAVVGTDELPIVRSLVNFRVAVSAVTAFSSASFAPVAGRLGSDHIAGASNIILETELPFLTANLIWAVIDPFTTQCEVRRISTVTGVTLGIGTNMTYAHAKDDPVLFVSDPTLYADWFAGDVAAALSEAAVAGISLVKLTPGVTYSISATLSVPPEVTLDGSGTVTSAGATATNQIGIISASAAMGALVDLDDFSAIKSVYLEGNNNATIGIQCLNAAGIRINPTIDRCLIRRVATGIKLGGVTFGSVTRNSMNTISGIGVDALASYGGVTYGVAVVVFQQNEYKGTTHHMRMEGEFTSLSDDFEGSPTTASIELAGANVSRVEIVSAHAEAATEFLRCSSAGSRIKLRGGLLDGAGLGGEVFANFVLPPSTFDMDGVEVQQFETIFTGTIPTVAFRVPRTTRFTTYTTFGVDAMTLYSVGYSRGLAIENIDELMYTGDEAVWVDGDVANFDCMLSKFHRMALTGAASIRPSTAAGRLVRGHRFTIQFDGFATLDWDAATTNRFNVQAKRDWLPAAGEIIEFEIDSNLRAREIGKDTADNYFATTFGVVADGTTDDTAAWNAAITFVGNAGGGTIHTPPTGTSRLSTAVLMNQDDVTIKGHGSHSFKQTDLSVDTRTILLSANNCTFDSVRIDGNQLGGTLSLRYGIEVAFTAQNTRILNCEIFDTLASSVRVNGGKVGLIQGCYIHDNPSVSSGDGILITVGGVQPATDWRILGNHIETMGRTPVVLIECTDIVIDGNTFFGATNSMFDIEPNAGGDLVKRVDFTNNVCRDNGISSSIGFGCTAQVQDEVSDIVIANNVFEVDEYAGAIALAANVTIANNQFRVSRKVGIAHLLQITNTKHARVLGNVIVEGNPGGTVTDAVLIDGAASAGAIVAQNHITNADRHGINMQAANAIVNNNVIDNPADEGILIGSANAECSNNVITDAGDIGISVNAVDAVVNLNRIFDSVGRGIVVTASGDRCKVATNLVDTPGGIGIQINSGSVDVRVLGNTVLDGLNRGIDNNGGVRCKIVGNDVKGSAGVGIRATSTVADCLINGNELYDNTGAAIQVDGDEITVSDNMTGDTGVATQTHGINIGATADFLIIANNNFRGNVTAARTGSTPANYKPDPNGTFATDMGNFNFE